MTNQPTTAYLPALGIVCALGQGKQQVSNALFGGQISDPSTYTQLISGRKVPILRVQSDLPHLPAEFKTLDSRNNRLLKMALDEIAPLVKKALEKYGKHRVGVILGTSSSGILEGENAFIYKKRSGNFPETYHYEQQETASPSIFTSRYFDLNGPSYTISTACTSGSKALCSAHRLLQANICDAVITGGVDSLCQTILNGFDSLDLISENICNPFSKNRDGITIGEGAAVFLMTKEHLSDEAPVEFLGGGESSDSYHISSPDPNGKGAELAIREGLVPKI